jgi:hypothetical protein
MAAPATPDRDPHIGRAECSEQPLPLCVQSLAGLGASLGADPLPEQEGTGLHISVNDKAELPLGPLHNQNSHSHAPDTYNVSRSIRSRLISRFIEPISKGHFSTSPDSRQQLGNLCTEACWELGEYVMQDLCETQIFHS